MALDMKGGPNWVNNFVDAPIIINPDQKEYYRQPSYYALAHFSKFLPPGSVRVDSFRTPNSSTVLILVNTESIAINFLAEDDKAGKIVSKVEPKSIQTIVYYD